MRCCRRPARASSRSCSGNAKNLVVGKVTPAELALPLRRARELLGRDINSTVYTPTEFDKKRIAKDSFLRQVLAKPRLLVIEGQHDLGKATG